MPTENPWPEQATIYSAQDDRRALQRSQIQPGVLGQTELKVSVTATARQVSVAAGGAVIAGSHASVVRQGYYSAHLPAAEVFTLAVGGAQPRIDQIVLRIRDSVPGSGVVGDASNTGTIEVIAGTPTAGATIANRSGVGTIPPSCLLLADVLVPASYNSAFVQNTHVRDRRPWARGFWAYVQGISSSPGRTTGLSPIADMGLRAELSGAPANVRFNGTFTHNTAGQLANIHLYIDGTEVASPSIAGRSVQFYTTGAYITVAAEWPIQLAGSHLIEIWWETFAGTLTNNVQQRVMIVEEFPGRPFSVNAGA